MFRPTGRLYRPMTMQVFNNRIHTIYMYVTDDDSNHDNDLFY